MKEIDIDEQGRLNRLAAIRRRVDMDDPALLLTAQADLRFLLAEIDRVWFQEQQPKLEGIGG